MNLFALLALGLLLGLRHATDPDHVVAVTAMAARTRRVLPATLLGTAWGLGHSLTLFLVAGAIILFKWVVPPRLGLAVEFTVALALILVGLLNFRAREHEHGTVSGGRLPAARAFGVGIVHGLAGSAAVALLVIAAVPDPGWALGYLGLFAFGTLAGMALITTGFVVPLATAARRWKDAGKWVRLSTGTLSIVSGVWLAYQIGWRGGLFLAHVSWTSR